uniref:Uncharacterized protein n=1 Tax=viral metagenome TaxID=1070528 RepID=A0A6C0J545_9ZZZZ
MLFLIQTNHLIRHQINILKQPIIIRIYDYRLLHLQTQQIRLLFYSLFTQINKKEVIIKDYLVLLIMDYIKYFVHRLIIRI